MFSQLHVVWQIMRGQRLRYGLALACLLVATGLNYLVPLVGSVTIDYAVDGKSPLEGSRLLTAMLVLFGGPETLRAHLWIAPVAMVVFAAIGGGFTYLKGWLASLASDGIARRLKDDLYDHLNHLPMRYHDRADTGDLVQRCTSDVETTRQFLAVQVMEIGHALLLAGAALPLLLSLHVPMTLLSFALIGPIIVYGYVYFARVRHVFKQVDEAEGVLTGVIQENLTGIRVVRAFARQDHERARFAGPNAAFRDKNLRLLRLMSWYWSISDFVSLGQLGLTLLVGAYWVVTGALTVGVLFAFLSYLGIMLWPVRQMGRILTDLGKTTVALGRIKEVFAVAREVDPPQSGGQTADGRGQTQTLSGAIRVRDLRFRHGGDASSWRQASRPAVSGAFGTAGTEACRHEAGGAPHALNGVSFDVAPGETLAILGPSGSGKSTLMHLILRLYDYAEGSIQLDGRELATLPRKDVRRQIGVVMQEPFLFSKTLRENLRLGRGDAPDQEIEEAARAACIHDAIVSFERGYDTLIGERGITLSGGQRQRMAIARAILKRPPILILDDALSAVDGETETMILEALRQRRGQATTLVIAHRLSTLAHADRVIVLDRGEIIQSGTHAELAARDGLYRRLWKIQTEVEADFRRELQAG